MTLRNRESEPLSANLEDSTPRDRLIIFLVVHPVRDGERAVVDIALVRTLYDLVTVVLWVDRCDGGQFE